jgi:D,D-heptose 1,7-bisphosphate phosphatase
MRAIFLDRDGTINDDVKGYISSPDDFHLFPWTAKALNLFHEMGYLTILITNQSGIARGLYTIADLEKVHQYMIEELAKEGAFFDLILYSPYYAKGTVTPYNIEHISRKPAPGMFFEALHKFPIKAKESYMIGDKPADIEFGKRNGLTSILVKTGLGRETWENIETLAYKPDFVVENVLSASLVVRRS